jgi:hypothetical protein
MLDALNGLYGVSLEPAPVEIFGHQAKLDDEVIRVVRLGLAGFSRQRCRRAASSSPTVIRGVRAADELSTIDRFEPLEFIDVRLRQPRRSGS